MGRCACEVARAAAFLRERSIGCLRGWSIASRTINNIAAWQLNMNRQKVGSADRILPDPAASIYLRAPLIAGSGLQVVSMLHVATIPPRLPGRRSNVPPIRWAR